MVIARHLFIQSDVLVKVIIRLLFVLILEFELCLYFLRDYFWHWQYEYFVIDGK